MSESKMIKLARYKKSNYKVNFEGKGYSWAGSKGNNFVVKEVPEEVVDYLMNSTGCFKKGELVILDTDKNKLAKEKEENIFEKEEYENNSLSRKEIEDLLKSNMNTMKAGLSKITSQTTKNFVLSIAKEIKLSNANKQKFLKDCLGLDLPIEDIFETE